MQSVKLGKDKLAGTSSNERSNVQMTSPGACPRAPATSRLDPGNRRCHASPLASRIIGVYWPAALARSTSRATHAGAAAAVLLAASSPSPPLEPSFFTIFFTGSPRAWLAGLPLILSPRAAPESRPGSRRVLAAWDATAAIHSSSTPMEERSLSSDSSGGAASGCSAELGTGRRRRGEAAVSGRGGGGGGSTDGERPQSDAVALPGGRKGPEAEVEAATEVLVGSSSTGGRGGRQTSRGVKSAPSQASEATQLPSPALPTADVDSNVGSGDGGVMGRISPGGGDGSAAEGGERSDVKRGGPGGGVGGGVGGGSGKAGGRKTGGGSRAEVASGGRSFGSTARGDSGKGGGRSLSLPDRIRACRSMEALVALYDATQREAEAQATDRARGAGATAAAAGLAAGAAGLPAGAVWMFLAAAGELVAGWREGVPARYRRARLQEATDMRAQLSRLLSAACGVVLWAERLPPAKVCLLLSLMVAAGARHPGAEQHLGLLAEDSLNALEQYSSGEVALTASSFARLRFFPGRGWLETLLEATSGRLSTYRPIDLGFLLWSLAKWRVKPPPEWLLEYYRAFEDCGERVHERELSMVCWALGVGAVGGAPRPPDSLTNMLMLEVQVRLPTLGSQGFAHVAWGLCCCDVRPPGFWLRDFTEAAKATFPYASNGLAFSNLLWALAVWQGELRPDQELLEEACKHSARWLHTLDSRGLAVLLLALSDLGYTPPADWVSLALETAHRKLTSTDPASAVAVLWAVSRFERQRAAAAAEAAAAEAAAGGQPAAAALPPRRRRLSSLTPEELLLVADDIGFGFGFGADGRTPGSAGTPLALRPPRKWLVRYYPIIKDFAMAAAGAPPEMTHRVRGRRGAPDRRPVAGAAAAAAAVAGDWEGGAPAAGFVSRAADPAAASASFAFAGLDTRQMLDLAVALADLYVYPGDGWMAAHEAHMALYGSGGGGGGGGGGGRGAAASGGARSGGRGLTPYQLRLLMASYAALEDTEEEYAAPRAWETY